MKRIGILSVTFAAMLMVACGDGRNNERTANDRAVGTAGSDANRDADIPRMARGWFEDRVRGNLAEVKLGELASQRAQHADVKAFGSLMVQDHTKANEELTQIGSKYNVQPPIEVDEDHRELIDRHSKKEAGEFDRDYVNAMVDGHQDTLEALEDRLDKQGDDRNPQYTAKRSDNAFETELNEWAAKTAPTVQQHLDKAKQLKETLDRRTTNR